MKNELGIEYTVIDCDTYFKIENEEQYKALANMLNNQIKESSGADAVDYYRVPDGTTYPTELYVDAQKMMDISDKIKFDITRIDLANIKETVKQMIQKYSDKQDIEDICKLCAKDTADVLMRQVKDVNLNCGNNEDARFELSCVVCDIFGKSSHYDDINALADVDLGLCTFTFYVNKENDIVLSDDVNVYYKESLNNGHTYADYVQVSTSKPINETIAKEYKEIKKKASKQPKTFKKQTDIERD